MADPFTCKVKILLKFFENAQYNSGPVFNNMETESQRGKGTGTGLLS